MRVTVSRPRRSLFGPYRAKTIAAAWAAEVGPMVLAALKEKSPVAKENGGRLRDSIRNEQANTPGGVTLTFTAQVPYAKWVLEGTAPHEIRPREKRALFWPGADHPVAVVNHPGTQPNRFPERAITPLIPVIRARYKEIAVEAMEGE
jgi:hypothetical protein